MRLHAFNAKKEYQKLMFKKNKAKYLKYGTIILSVCILVFAIMYFSFSKFSTAKKFNVINAKVGDFSSGDYTIAAYIDGTKSSTFPAKNTGYSVDKIECTNDATATWNYNNWTVNISATTSTKCNIYFLKMYDDGTGANVPELYQGLIPVTISTGGVIQVADTSQEWYNYASHNWANAVLVNCSDATIKAKYFDDNMNIRDAIIGQTVTQTDILQMYVWIPRYKYLLWNAENGTSDPQAISIVFEKATDAKSTGSTNGTWLTHPAFTFGTTELQGIWVGKFEESGTTSALTIKPNITSLRNISLGDMFNATRNIELVYSSNYGILSSQVDTHVIKNMDWGAVTYLSSSIYGRYTDSTTCISSGCQIWNNPNSSYITGCSGTSIIAASTTACNAWNTSTGANSSTSGTQYGVYDMSGGAWDYVMGTMQSSTGTFYSGSSSMSTVDSKYYDSYPYGTNAFDFSRSKLGDATKEIIKTVNTSYGSWYSNYSSMLAPGVEEGYWYMRGGAAFYGTSIEGIYTFYPFYDNSNFFGSFHSVLTAQ